MNHPKPEEWVPYLYGGLKPEARRHLKAHLSTCTECRGQLERWQRTTHRLQAWKLPRAGISLELFAPALKWATAALVVLAIGFGVGRFTGTRTMVARVRAQVEGQVRQQVQQQLAQLVKDEVARTSPALLRSAADQTEKLLTSYNTLFNEPRFQSVENSCVALKRQLDTVAINTQQEFVQLATYHPPSRSSQQ